MIGSAKRAEALSRRTWSDATANRMDGLHGLEKLNGKSGRAKQRRHNSWSIRGSQMRVHAWGGCDELQAVQCSAFELVPWSEVQRMLVEVLGRGAVAAMQRMQVRIL